MKVLIKQAKILCSSSAYHNQIKDILIVDGIIQEIGSVNDEEALVVSSPSLCISPGWHDIFADFAEPGYEHRETLATGALAAASGGFTSVMLVPNTKPAISSKTEVEYILQKSRSLPATLLPIATVTKNAEGKDLAEMYDMHAAGSVAFGDGKNGIQNPGVMLKALQYVLAINATVVQVPGDKSIGSHGLMNESITSTRLGLPGLPAIAEEIMIARDIELLKYTGSKLHFTGVSTSAGLQLILNAIKTGLNLSCSVTPYHCWFCEEDLSDYDTNLKVDPPLRSRTDMMAIRQAALDGKVAIASHHIPQHLDNKACEFEYAKNGMTGLQTVFPVLNTLGANIETLVEQLAVLSRNIFGLKVPEIKEGEAAVITMFDPEMDFTFSGEMNQSLSSNSPFLDQQFKGKVIGTINDNKMHLTK